MSKIHKIRFVNLNYNYNTMKIDDEKFYLNGENTMLNLRNGGGTNPSNYSSHNWRNYIQLLPNTRSKNRLLSLEK